MTYSLEELDKIFELAFEVASEKSSDTETKVGAVVEIPNGPFQRNYLKTANTFVNGAKNIGLPTTRPDKHQFMIHAEQNLVFEAARKGVPLEGRVVICTLSPCHNCLRSLWQAGVSEVYFKEVYKAYIKDMTDIVVSDEKIGPYTRLILAPVSV